MDEEVICAKVREPPSWVSEESYPGSGLPSERLVFRPRTDDVELHRRSEFFESLQENTVPLVGNEGAETQEAKSSVGGPRGHAQWRLRDCAIDHASTVFWDADRRKDSVDCRGHAEKLPACIFPSRDTTVAWHIIDSAMYKEPCMPRGKRAQHSVSP